MFNALVLFCIRDIDAAMQRMLNLKPSKDENKYEEDVASPDLKILLNVSVSSVNRVQSSHFIFQTGASLIQSKVAEKPHWHQDVSQWISSGMFRDE